MSYYERRPRESIGMLITEITQIARISKLGSTGYESRNEETSYENRKNRLLALCVAIETAHNQTHDETYKTQLIAHLEAVKQYIVAISTPKPSDEIKISLKLLKQTCDNCSGFRHKLLIPGVACFSTGFGILMLSIFGVFTFPIIFKAGSILGIAGFVLMI